MLLPVSSMCFSASVQVFCHGVIVWSVFTTGSRVPLWMVWKPVSSERGMFGRMAAKERNMS